MTHVVCEPCFACKYTDCVVVCPVECFYEGEQMLYIHPDECIDCGACVPACPVAAIYDSPESTPKSQTSLIEANAIFRSGDPATLAKAEALVSAHVAAHPELMAIPPSERANAHNK